jgi:uncharacterized protein (TIGR02598 family)
MKLYVHYKSKFSSSAGFTLAEVSLAVAICVLGLMGVLAMLPQALTSARDASARTHVTRIVEERLSDFRANPRFSPSAPSYYYDINGLYQGTASRPTSHFQVIMYCVAHASAGESYNVSDSVDITVQVIWPCRSSIKTYDYFTTTITCYDKP